MPNGSALIAASEKVSSMHDWYELCQCRKFQTLANLFILEDGSFIEYDHAPPPQVTKRPILRTCGVIHDLQGL